MVICIATFEVQFMKNLNNTESQKRKKALLIEIVSTTSRASRS